MANDAHTRTAFDTSTPRRWWCIGGGALRCDVRKVVLWVLLIVGVLVTWGLWALLGDLQARYDKQHGAAPVAASENQKLNP